MKKLITIAVITACSATIANAQNARFGFSAGTVIANYNAKSDGEDETAKSKAGLTVGVLADVPLSKNFSFQPALNFLQKGTKDEDTYMGVTEKMKLTVSCLELPLNFLYNSSGENGSFFIGAGPSFGFNLSGKIKWDDGTDSETESIEIGNDEDNDMIKGLDIGANILAGYRFPNGLFFSAGYNAGLNNLLPGNPDGETVKSNYFGIKIGFLLNGGKAKK